MINCCFRKSDYFFESEWVSSADNVSVLTAFSRDQEDKVYVQHVMDSNRQLLRQLVLEQQGIFFVAGNSKFMPSQVSLKMSGCSCIQKNSMDIYLYLILFHSTWRNNSKVICLKIQNKLFTLQVREALVEAVAETTGKDEAESLVEKMELTGRYQTETWS